MPPKRNAGESKQGLVITLVFFILTTIGLGVGTYYGFADQEAAHKKQKDAEDKEKLAQDTAKWNRYKAQQLQAYYVGGLNAEDSLEVSVNRTQFEQGKLGAKEKDRAEFAKTLDDLDKKLGWDKEGKKAKTVFPDTVKAEQAKVAELQKQLAALETAKKAADKRAEDAVAEKEAAQKQFDEKLATITKNLQNDNSEDRKTIASLRVEIARLGDAMKKMREEAEKDVATVKLEVNKKSTEIATLKQALAAKTSEAAQNKKITVEAPREWRTDWKIIRMDQRGTNPYINLGTADHVKAGLTFSIHAVSLDGKPEPVAKATLEVVSPLDAHLSRTRITAVRDPDRDPVMEGDVLYNPSWDPHIKKHIALTGVIDLTGDGRDSTQEFKRAMEKQNIIVDSYLNTNNFKTEGKGMTLRTDYLVIGEGRGSLADSRDATYLKNLEDAINKSRQEATKLGVPVISLYRYMEMIGYHLPKTPESDRPGSRPNNRRY